MKKIFIAMCVVLLCAGNILASDESYSVEEFEDALAPTKTRGLGKIISEDQKPSATMRLQFGLNSADLTPDAVKRLRNLGKAIQREKLKDFVFKIEGHTCNLGTDDHNRKLSQQRALSVRNYLMNTFDLPESQFAVEGYGEKKPMVANTDENARKKNRRVVVRNTLKKLDMSKAGTGNERPKVSVEIKTVRNGQEDILQEDGALAPEDKYAVEFTPRAGGYVYVYQVDSKGKTDQLFPNDAFSEESNPVEPGILYRVPSQGKWFQLDENRGKEHFVVLAYKKPLERAQEICRQVLNPSSPIHNSVMIASSRGLTRGFKGVRRAEKERGLGGIKEEQPQNSPEPPKKTPASSPRPESPQLDTGSLFVWKQQFFHR